MNFSFWDQKSFLNGYDVLIAGSGIVGLSAAFYLKTSSPKLKIAVLERGPIPSGASTRNAGVACFGTLSEILEDLAHHPEEEVFGLVKRRWEGLKNLRNLLGDEAIRFRQDGGYELFSLGEKKISESCYARMAAINNRLEAILGSRETFKDAGKKIPQFGFSGIHSMIVNSSEGQIDSGEMMTALLQKVQQCGVTIINGTTIHLYTQETDHVRLECNGDLHFRTKKLLLATNGFSKKLAPELDVLPARAQVLVTSEIENLSIKGSFHFDKGYYYFRNIGKRILFGGGRNLDFKTEETTAFGLTDLVQKKLEWHLREHILPNHKFEIEHRWSGIMGMGSGKLPIIEAISKDVYCAVRMSGMGVAIGTLVGKEAAILIQSHT